MALFFYVQPTITLQARGVCWAPCVVTAALGDRHICWRQRGLIVWPEYMATVDGLGFEPLTFWYLENLLYLQSNTRSETYLKIHIFFYNNF